MKTTKPTILLILLGLCFSPFAVAADRYYPLTDHHGSVRLLTDSSGNVVNSYTYTPYGEVTASSSSPTIPYQYTSGDCYPIAITEEHKMTHSLPF